MPGQAAVKGASPLWTGRPGRAVLLTAAVELFAPTAVCMHRMIRITSTLEQSEEKKGGGLAACALPCCLRVARYLTRGKAGLAGKSGRGWMGTASCEPNALVGFFVTAWHSKAPWGPTTHRARRLFLSRHVRRATSMASSSSLQLPGFRAGPPQIGRRQRRHCFHMPETQRVHRVPHRKPRPGSAPTRQFAAPIDAPRNCCPLKHRTIPCCLARF